MKKLYLVLVSQLLILLAMGQSADSISAFYVNSAEKLLLTEGQLLIGGYGEVHYNQPLDAEVRSNGKLDVHRMVMLFGYQFNEKVQFISEVEFEHVKEVYIEQAFLQYKLNNLLNFRGGLLLVPMGIINEYHEPTTFNGVERPFIDNRIAPTTWREIGFGVTGTILRASLKYQAYVVNGFNGYDGDANLSGSNGFRSGRQKGAESYISAPNFTGKIEYFGIRGLNIGLSGYAGKTQSTLYNGLQKDKESLVNRADSSVVGITMMGTDARYSYGGFQLRGQLYYAEISNSNEYNDFTSSNLGSALTGYYLEGGYDVLRSINASDASLIPFLRYSKYNTHHKVAGDVTANPAFDNQVITTGLTLRLSKGAVVKTDLQLIKSNAVDNFSKVFNAGIGIMF